jgi:hypothetical protein
MPTHIESNSLPKEGKCQESSSFLKKRTKKLLFVSCHIGPRRGVRAYEQQTKVFWFFFSKKKYFLASPA